MKEYYSHEMTAVYEKNGLKSFQIWYGIKHVHRCMYINTAKFERKDCSISEALH